jgi:Spy/CpxP family protein refolding chaperone
MGMMQSGMMQGGMMMMQGGMTGMMPAHEVVMRAMLLSPQHVTALGEDLNLTDEQIAALDHLRQPAMATPHGHMASEKADGDTLADLFDAEVPDTAAIRAAAVELFQSQAGMHVQTLVNAAAVKQILTPSQREVVLAAASGVHCEDGN